MIIMKSKKARKQRKRLHQQPLHRKRKKISSHLEEDLLLKYDRRSLPVVEGDTVKVMRGDFKGHEDKVADVNVKEGSLEIEGLTMTKADGTKIPQPVDPSNVMITKLNLTDKLRRGKIEQRVSEETRKEIEREAEEQIKEIEEQQKKEREEEEAKKETEEKEEKEEETEEQEEETEKETKKSKSNRKTASKEQQKKGGKVDE